MRGKRLVIGKPPECPLTIFRGKESLSGDYFVRGLNAIKDCDWLLRKIFEGQEVNAFGLYILKICQDGSWKYILIDDFIPVAKGKPAFIDVRQEKEGVVDIWPFLLEKAYANHYSNY